MLTLLEDLRQRYRLSYLFISHDMAVVERISHRVAVMYRGRIVEIGPRRAVFENPQHPYTRKLMAAVPVATRATVIRSGFCCLMTSRAIFISGARRSPACRCSRSGRATSSPANPPMCWAEHNNT